MGTQSIQIGDTVKTPAGNVGVVEDVYRKRFVKVSSVVGYLNVESLTLIKRASAGLFKGLE